MVKTENVTTDPEVLRSDARMLELRLLDTSGFINRKLDDGSVSIAGSSVSRVRFCVCSSRV